MATAPVRPGRSRGLVVAITGAASGPGRALAARLSDRLSGSAPAGRASGLRKVIALDDHRGDVSGVVWRVVDIRDPLLSHRISDVDTIVHLDIDHSPDSERRARRAHNLSGANSVLGAAAAARISHVVLVTGAIVGAADATDPGIAEDFGEIERLAAVASAGHPELICTVVRPAVLVGPGLDTAVTRHLAAPRLVGLRGAATRWQFCHIDDLASALEHVILSRVRGVVGVGSDGWLGPDDVVKITGRRRLDLPGRAVYGMAHRLYRLGLFPAPVLEPRYAAHPWVVDGATLRSAGWKPAHDNASVLRALVRDTGEGRHREGPGKGRWEGRRADGSRRRRTRAGLLVAAGAGSVTLLAGLGLLVRGRRGRSARRSGRRSGPRFARRLGRPF